VVDARCVSAAKVRRSREPGEASPHVAPSRNSDHHRCGDHDPVPLDFGQLEPMVTTALRELEHAGVTERPRTVLADAGS
jgi:hypothetical protein